MAKLSPREHPAARLLIRMKTGDNTSSGRLLAKLLRGSWREALPALDISADELDQSAPLLLGSGAAALVWRRVRATELRASGASLELQQAYRLQAIHAAVYEHDLKRAFHALRSNGIEPLLIKGWAVAQSYPERGLRPLGDMDLCVAPREYDGARLVLEELNDNESPIDLHRGLSKLDDRSWDELFARSQQLPLFESSVRVLAPEDHLRILSVHMLKHGAWRPLWLCDVAAALESRPANFDWKRCLGNRRRASWVACALMLAHRLLGAELDGTPSAVREAQLPGWLVAAVLKQWAAPFTPSYYRMPMADALRYRKGLLAALKSRWPNPVEATVHLRAPFNEWPRWPFQFGSSFLRAAEFTRHLRKSS
ncbi:MAG TPA: nucleotidyltransferase family protein [Pyrinomonadaceae bacterium]